MNAASEVSVVVVVKNGASTLGPCLDAILAERPREIVAVVAGESNDDSLTIATSRIKDVIVSWDSTLAHDRQSGIDATTGMYVAMIDADHLVEPGQIRQMVDAMGQLAAAQAGLRCHVDAGFWARAEDDYWKSYHNVPVGARKIIGTAPTVYKRAFLEECRFTSEMTGSADDTDFFLRASRETNFRVGVVPVVVEQVHDSRLGAYVRKFMWYGRGDFEFMRHHPDRILNHLWHLAVRYCLLRPVGSLLSGSPKTALFCLLMGSCRLVGVVGAGAARLRVPRREVLR